MSAASDRAAALAIDVEHRPTGVVLSLAGEIDISTAPLLRAALGEAAAERRPVVLDLSRVTFVDSSGVRALVDGQATVQAGGGVLALMTPSPAVERLFELTGLGDRFPRVSSASDGAMRELASSAGRPAGELGTQG